MNQHEHKDRLPLVLDWSTHEETMAKHLMLYIRQYDVFALCLRIFYFALQTIEEFGKLICVCPCHMISFISTNVRCGN